MNNISSTSGKFNKHIKLPKGFKLPRKKKKLFKNSLDEIRVSLTFKEGNVKNQSVSLCNVLYNSFMLNKYNLTSYKTLKKIKIGERIIR